MPRPPTEWKHRTMTGRITYEKPKHTFTGSDVLRVYRGFVDQASIAELIEIAVQAARGGLDGIWNRLGPRSAVGDLLLALFDLLRSWLYANATAELVGAVEKLHPQVAELLVWIKQQLEEWTEFLMSPVIPEEEKQIELFKKI